MEPQATIRVFVTKSWEFRAKVEPHDKDTPNFEVTVGGKSWNEGKGQPWQNKILRKCHELVGVMGGKLCEISAACPVIPEHVRAARMAG